MRKQQFAAVALIMGLLPLILKDVAWPHRRIVCVKHQQQWYKEVMIRALGLKPVEAPKQAARELRSGRTFNKLLSTVLILLLVLLLGLTYAALLVMEIYFKWSSLGCPFPVTILVWTLFAVVLAFMDDYGNRFNN